MRRVVLLLCLAACSSEAAPPSHAPHSSSHEALTTDRILDRVAAVHGAPGPYAVAGYRMGEAALRALGVDHAGQDVKVIHASPAAVQFACIADGLQAATGASVGHMNLARVEAPEADMHSIVRDERTGREVEVRLRREYIDSLGEMNDANLRELGARVATAPESELFTLVVRETR